MDENGLRPHLTIDLQVPTNIKTDEIISLSAIVQKSNQPFEHAEEAVFTVWLEDNPEQQVVLPATQHSPGIYEAEYVFPAEGLYIIQSHVLAVDMEVMPSKRVAIGKEAMEHLALLEQGKDNHSLAPANHSHH